MKIIRVLAMLVVVLSIIVSCTPSYYTKAQSSEIESQGTKLIKEYLDKEYTSYELKDVYMLTGAKPGGNVYAGYYTSSCVKSRYVVDGKDYDIVVNIETGDIYTSVLSEEVCAYVEEKINSYFEKAGYDNHITVLNVDPENVVICHNMKTRRGEILDTEVSFSGVYKTDTTLSDVKKQIDSKAPEMYLANMNIRYAKEEDREFPKALLGKFCEENTFFNEYVIFCKEAE